MVSVYNSAKVEERKKEVRKQPQIKTIIYEITDTTEMNEKERERNGRKKGEMISLLYAV